MKTTALRLCALSLFAALLCQQCVLWDPKTIEVPCPKITGFAPKGGAFGEAITVTGEGFCPGRPDLHIVKIGNNTIVPDDSVTVVDAQTLRFKVPKGAENGAISVTLQTAESCPAVSGEVFTYYYTATVSTFAGQTPGTLSGPMGLDIDSKKNIWVADQNQLSNPKINFIRKIGPDGNVIRSIGGGNIGCTNNPVSSIEPISFNQPTDVATDPGGNVYVSDRFNSVIKKINVAEGIDHYAGKCGEPDENLLGGTCLGTARFLSPLGLCHDNARVFVLDGGHVKKIDENCNVSLLVGKGGMIAYANAIALSRARPGTVGPLIVAESIGEKGLFSVNDNTGAVRAIPLIGSEKMSNPSALQVDQKGNIFIADKEKHQIFVAYTDGRLEVLAGTGDEDDSNGNGKVAKFRRPSGLLLTAESGSPVTLYVSDFGNRKIKRIILY